jgi:hypothetical protein
MTNLYAQVMNPGVQLATYPNGQAPWQVANARQQGRARRARLIRLAAQL